MSTRKVIFRPANCEGVSERKPEDEARLALTMPGEYGLPDVVLFSEVSWLDVAQIARRHGYHAVQFGDRGSAQAGVAIASRERLTHAHFAIGSRPVPGVRLRPIVTARLDGVPVSAIHAPTQQTPVAQAAYMARVHARGGIIGGDFNRTHRWMRAEFDRRYVSLNDEVLGLLVPQKYKVGRPFTIDVDSDHAAIDIPVHLPVREKP